MLPLRTLAALLVLVSSPVAAKNIYYGGVVIKVDTPSDGELIRGSFEPQFSIEFYDGYLGEALRWQNNRGPSSHGASCCMCSLQ